MKKILAVLLVLTMVFALFACTEGGKEGETSPPPPDTPAANIGGDASPDTPSSEDGEMPSGSTVGYVTDDVDHWARDAYHIVYYNYNVTNLTAQTTDALTLLGENYNFTVEQLTANGDADAYINNLQTILLREPDGMVVDISAELAPVSRKSSTNMRCPPSVSLTRR